MNKVFVEIIKERDGTYRANMTQNGTLVTGIKEYVDYRTLKKSIENATGFEILKQKDLFWSTFAGKQYTAIQNYKQGDPRMKWTGREWVQA